MDTTWIVIVNYGRANDTIECLKSLALLDDAAFRVVLIDNRSPDDSVARLTTWLAQNGHAGSDGWISLSVGPRRYDLRFVASDRNGGFAAGCNIGMRLALQDPDCRYVWLLNNDTLVEPASLRALVDRTRADDRIGMCGSTLVYADPADTVQAYGGHYRVTHAGGWLVGAGDHRDTLAEAGPVEDHINYVVGASMLVTRAFIEQVGLMDERYFLYFEELDWSIRGRRHGYTLGWARDSIVIHKEGASIGSSSRGAESPLAIRFMTASYLRLIRAHHPRLLPVAIARTMGKVAKRMLRGDRTSARATFDGLHRFLRSPSTHRPEA